MRTAHFHLVHLYCFEAPSISASLSVPQCALVENAHSMEDPGSPPYGVIGSLSDLRSVNLHITYYSNYPLLSMALSLVLYIIMYLLATVIC